MQRDTFTKLGLVVFGLLLLSFLTRGFGQLVVGHRTALRAAALLAVVPAVLVALLVTYWVLAQVGLTTLEE